MNSKVVLGIAAAIVIIIVIVGAFWVETSGSLVSTQGSTAATQSSSNTCYSVGPYLCWPKVIYNSGDLTITLAQDNSDSAVETNVTFNLISNSSIKIDKAADNYTITTPSAISPNGVIANMSMSTTMLKLLSGGPVYNLTFNVNNVTSPARLQMCWDNGADCQIEGSVLWERP